MMKKRVLGFFGLLFLLVAMLGILHFAHFGGFTGYAVLKINENGKNIYENSQEGNYLYGIIIGMLGLFAIFLIGRQILRLKKQINKISFDKSRKRVLIDLDLR